MTGTPMVRHIDEAKEEVWSDTRGSISFRTTIGDGSTPTEDLCSGVAHLEPGGWLSLHRHAAAEVYHVLTGQGDLPLEFLDVYQADSIQDMEYVWSQD